MNLNFRVQNASSEVVRKRSEKVTSSGVWEQKGIEIRVDCCYQSESIVIEMGT